MDDVWLQFQRCVRYTRCAFMFVSLSMHWDELWMCDSWSERPDLIDRPGLMTFDISLPSRHICIEHLEQALWVWAAIGAQASFPFVNKSRLSPVHLCATNAQAVTVRNRHLVRILSRRSRSFVNNLFVFDAIEWSIGSSRHPLFHANKFYERRKAFVCSFIHALNECHHVCACCCSAWVHSIELQTNGTWDWSHWNHNRGNVKWNYIQSLDSSLTICLCVAQCIHRYYDSDKSIRRLWALRDVKEMRRSIKQYELYENWW